MTRSEKLIARALDFAIDKDAETFGLIIDLVTEYEIAVKQALKVERALHNMIKESEK